ncbi:MAG: hypothetical protein U5Q03_03260 [Bacteroidota bacterium]|nr:hypothetical protein [Bacteroidota bacterium]
MNSFAEDVFRGLSCSNKYLLSMYFYDEEGGRLLKENLYRILPKVKIKRI